MPDNELRVDVRTTGQQELEQIDKAIRGLTDAMAAGTSSVRQYEEALATLQALLSAKKDIEREIADAVKRTAEEEKRAAEALRARSEEYQAFGNKVKEFVENPLRAVGSMAGDLASSLGPAGVAFVGVATAIGLATVAAYELAAATGALAEQQSNIAVRTGLTVHEVGLFTQAAENAGVGAEGFTTAMRTLSKGLSENSEEGQKVKTTFHAMGIETTNALGSVRPMGELWRDIADKLGAIEDPAARAAAAISLLGRGGLEVLPLLNKEFGTTLTELQRLGVGFTDEGAAKAKQFDNSIDLLTTRIKVLKREMGEGFAEGFMNILRLFPDSVSGDDDKQRKLRREKEKADFTAKYADFQTVANGGTLALTGPGMEGTGFKAGSTAAPGFSIADVEAAQKASDKTRIIGLINQQNTDTEKLAATEKKLGEAVAANNVAAVIGLQSEIKGIQARIEAAKEHEKVLQLRATSAKQAFGAENALVRDPAERIENSRQEALAGAKDPEQKRNINRTYDAQQETEKRRLEEEQYRAIDVETTRHITQKDDARKQAQHAENELLTPGARAAAELQQKLGSTDDPDVIADYQRTAAAQTAKAAQKEDREIAGVRIRNESEQARGASRTQSQIGDLESAPGSERANIQRHYAEELALAERVNDDARREREAAGGEAKLDVEKRLGDLQNSQDAARRDRELALADLRRKERDGDRQVAGNLFEALRPGGGGIGKLVTGMATDQAKIIFQNVTTDSVTKVRESLGTVIGGQDGGKSGIGKALLGTVFAAKATPEVASTDANTTATTINTLALKTVATALVTSKFSTAGVSPMGDVTGGGALGGIPGFVGGGTDILGAITSGAGFGNPGQAKFASAISESMSKALGFSGDTSSASGGSSLLNSLKSNAGQFMSGASSALSGNLIGRMITPAGESVSTGAGTATVNTNAARVGSGVATAAVVIEGVKGVKAGIQEGGARGTIGAVGSAAATAAALDPEPISRAVLQTVALVSSVTRSLMGDPRAARAAGLENLVRSQHNFDTPGVALDQDTSGYNVDHDFRGRLRVSGSKAFPTVTDPSMEQSSLTGGYREKPGAVTPNFNVTINALDSKSVAQVFHENGSALADSFHAQLLLNHPVLTELRTNLDRQ